MSDDFNVRIKVNNHVLNHMVLASELRIWVSRATGPDWPPYSRLTIVNFTCLYIGTKKMSEN